MSIKKSLKNVEKINTSKNHGLALCCNTSPVFTITGASSSFVCPVCNAGAGRGGWSHDKPWIAGIWNKKFHISGFDDVSRKVVYSPAPPLDVGEPWRFATLKCTAQYPFGEEGTICSMPFILFKTKERAEERWLLSKDNYECIIDESRCFKNFSLRSFDGTEVDFTLPEFKSLAPFGVYINRSWCTDGTWNYSVNIAAYNHKWINYFTDALKPLFAK